MTREIDLSGPDGNVFIIKGYIKSWCNQLEEIDRSKYNYDKVKKRMDKLHAYNDYLDLFDTLFEDVIDYEFINDPRDE